MKSVAEIAAAIRTDGAPGPWTPTGRTRRTLAAGRPVQLREYADPHGCTVWTDKRPAKPKPRTRAGWA
ncbi:MAG: hypothetical protein OXU75_09285 [Deltaproteobacteria bacterium]|nr:hypothetical protein [Deltaproteobacteria bacterium]